MKKTTVYKKLHFAARKMRGNIKFTFKEMDNKMLLCIVAFFPVSIIWFVTIVTIGFIRFYRRAGEIRRTNYYKYLTYVLD